jgi:hypothetical protein
LCCNVKERKNKELSSISNQECRGTIRNITEEVFESYAIF